jgi:DNA helicase-2/ATP-dependent DNA helicase PcrA
MIQQVLARLNSEQFGVATTSGGIIRTIAGPGTGKTGTQTAHIANLINLGVNPEAILAITFTNKAASETRHRIVNNTADLGDVGWKVAASTYHSFCRKFILKPFENHDLFQSMGYKNGFIILDDTDSISVMKEVFSNLSGGLALLLDAAAINEKKMLALISDKRANGIEQSQLSVMIRANPHDFYLAKKIADLIKNYPNSLEGVNAENKQIMASEISLAMSQFKGNFIDTLVSMTWLKYADACAQADGIDFDDQLLFSLKLLREDKRVAARIAKRFEYIFLDEFQDCNICQWEIVKNIINEQIKPNLFVVGDDRQSIYSFRNANVAIMMGLNEELPNCKTNSLVVNYRSTQSIIELSNALSLLMPNQIGDGQLKAASKDVGSKPKLEVYKNGKEEAVGVVGGIKELIQSGINPSEIAVLYRNRTINRELIDALNASRMDYDIIGDVGFYQTAEIKSAVALLRILTRSNDVFAFAKLLDYATIGVSAVRLKTTVHEKGGSPIDAIEAIMGMDKRARNKAEDFMLDIKKLITQGKSIATEQDFLSLVLTTDAVKQVYHNNPESKAQVDKNFEEYRQKTVARFVQSYSAFWEKYVLPSFVKDSAKAAKKATNETEAELLIATILNNRTTNFKVILDRVATDMLKKDSVLSELVDDLVQRIDQDSSENLDAIQLLTNHASKGLEFGYVFLIGTEEETYNANDSEAEDIEEEGRNFFVAVTRAEKELYLSAAEFRVINGQGQNRSVLKLLHPLMDKLDLSPLALKALKGSDSRFEGEFCIEKEICNETSEPKEMVAKIDEPFSASFSYF